VVVLLLLVLVVLVLPLFFREHQLFMLEAVAAVLKQGQLLLAVKVVVVQVVQFHHPLHQHKEFQEVMELVVVEVVLVGHKHQE
jgi:hypothetical protein